MTLSRGKPLITDGYGLDQAELPPFDDGPLDPRQWFDDPALPFHIEIGSGKGTFLVEHAKREPAINLLGIEQAGEYYRYAADRIRRWELNNVRMLRADATEFIRFWCPDGIAQVVHLYFSDPWPKKRHHKRRVLQDRTLEDFHRLLAGGGELRLVTDHSELWAWYEERARANQKLFTREQFVGDNEGELVGTNYERKFAREGRPFFAMCLKRQDDAQAGD